MTLSIFVEGCALLIGAHIPGILFGKKIQRRGDEKIISEADRERFAAIDARAAAEKASAVAQEALASKSEKIVLLNDIIRNKDGTIAMLRAMLADANGRVAEHAASALSAISDARSSITEAVSIAKVASETMFGANTGEVEPALSVGNADRKAAQRLRQEREQEERG